MYYFFSQQFCCDCLRLQITHCCKQLALYKVKQHKMNEEEEEEGNKNHFIYDDLGDVRDLFEVQNQPIHFL